MNSVEFFSFFFVLYCVFFVDFLFLCVFPIHPIHLECTLQCHWVVPCTALRSNPTQPPCTTVVWIHPCIVAVQNLFGLGERKAQIRNVACHCTRTPSSTHCCTRPIQDCAPPTGLLKKLGRMLDKNGRWKMPSKAFLQACSPTEFFLWELLEWWGGRVAFVFCGLGAFEDMEKKVEYPPLF